MKKNKISFETRFWAGFRTGNPYSALDAVFDFAHLDYYKQNLTQAVLHCYKGKIYKQETPPEKIVYCFHPREAFKLSLTSSSLLQMSLA